MGDDGRSTRQLVHLSIHSIHYTCLLSSSVSITSSSNTQIFHFYISLGTDALNQPGSKA